MLDILILIYVARLFYNLAENHGKTGWHYAVIGIACTYGGIVVGALIIGIVGEIISPGTIEEMNERVIGIMAVPFGVLTCWLIYRYLKNSWSKPKEINRQTLDADLIVPQEPERYNKDER